MMNDRFKELLIILCCFVWWTYSFGQSPGELLTNYTDNQHSEKLYVSHDKPFYLPEETIYGSAFLVDATSHELISGDVIVTVELIDSKSEIKNSLKVQCVAGTASFSLKLDELIAAGSYSLRAYTYYQLNFDPAYIFQKEIRIVDDFSSIPPDTTHIDQVDIKFYPEGGHLINEVNSKVAFKATDKKGNPVNIEGYIEDTDGIRTGSFRSIKDGMGVFSITPHDNQTYNAVVTNNNGVNQYIQLPKPLPVGHSITVNNTQKDKLTIEISSSPAHSNAKIKIIGHLRGDVFLDDNIDLSITNKLFLSKANMPSGVLHFTLFDEDNRPLAKRLVYSTNTTKPIEIDISKTKLSLSTSSKDTFGFRLSSSDSTLRGIATISIYNSSIDEKLSDHTTINNYLLLQSDLRGKIRNINDYFQENNAQSRYLLDIVMMTHGWRKFKWLDVIKQNLDAAFPNPYEHESMQGSIKSTKRSPCQDVEVSLSVIRGEFLQNATQRTDDNCNFSFNEIDLSDSSSLFFTASSIHPKKKKKQTKYEISFKDNTPTYDIENNIYNYQLTPTKEQFKARPSYVNQERILNESLWSFELENVVVKSSYNRAQKLTDRAKKKYKAKGLYHISSAQKFDPTLPELEIYRQHTVYEMIQHVAVGASLVPENGKKRLMAGGIRSKSEYWIFVDGIRVDPIVLDAMDPERISIIDMPFGPTVAAIYGHPFVISLLTKAPEEMNETKSGTLKIQSPGYHYARDYFDDHPLDETPLTSDLRSSLYWNPRVELSTEPTTINFKTSELYGNHVIKVEGITGNGDPFYQLLPFEVSK